MFDWIAQALSQYAQDGAGDCAGDSGYYVWPRRQWGIDLLWWLKR